MVDLNIDELLSSTLKRVAEPGDPTGVAELIRSRVAAGDTGTPADGPQFSHGWGSWLPWVGAGLVVGVAGTALGASGLIGGPAPVTAETTISVAVTVSGLDCPSGAPLTTFSAGDRVLATARSDDGAFLAVRDGYDYGRTVWLPLRSVTVDSGDLESLPVDGCPQPVVTRNSPDPVPEPAPAPQPEPGPQPAPRPAPAPVPPAPTPDTTPPTPQQWSATPTAIYCPGSGASFPDTTTVTMTAADNVAVTGATVIWSGAQSGSAPMTASGSSWQYSYTAPAGASGTITFTVTARDAAGNVSSPRSAPVTVTCLI